MVAGSPLIGAWRLKTYEDRESVEDDWVETYGPSVDGLIIYDDSGWLAVQVAGQDGRYDAYFGRFLVVEVQNEGDGVRGVVKHEVVATSMANVMSGNQERPFRISGDTLILGDEQTWRRICERLH
jgi:hypothetical protein